MDRISGSIYTSSWIIEAWMYDIQEFKDRAGLPWILHQEVRLFVLGMIRF